MKLLFGLFFVLSMSVPSHAMEIAAPEVPAAVSERMPQNTENFGEALLELIRESVPQIFREADHALQVSFAILSTALLASLLSVMAEKVSSTVTVAGVVMISAVIFQHDGSLIGYALETVQNICTYGKLLCPVMTTALAAQGGVTTSAALYAGTAAFITLLSMLVSGCFIHMVNGFLALSVSYGTLGEEFLKKLADAVKSVLSWLLKTMLIVFTTYMSVTGVVSGTTDAAALKTAKVTISSVVPVVGGILSDASESVLVSMGILKNAAGIYGILAVFTVAIGPIIEIGVQYLILKVTAAVCTLFGNKRLSTLVESFSAAMGLLVAMIASACLLVLISTVCFLKGCG